MIGARLSPPRSLPLERGGDRDWLVAALLRMPAAALPGSLCRAAARHFGVRRAQVPRADFAHFAYVNPDAPKGGRFSQLGPGSRLTFDSFNPFILKGDPAQGIAELVFDRLMVRAADEPDSAYGLVARTADVAADRMSVTFDLRPEARFADGSAVTADDVVFSYDTLKAKGHPSYRSQLRDVVRAEPLGRHRVRFQFQGTEVRDLPLTVADLPVLSKAWYTAAQLRGDLARAAAGLGSLSRRRAPARHVRDIPAPARLLGGRACRSIAGGTTSTRSATSISAIAPRRWRASRPAPTTSARSSPRVTGRRPTTSAPCATAASSA